MRDIWPLSRILLGVMTGNLGGKNCESMEGMMVSWSVGRVEEMIFAQELEIGDLFLFIIILDGIAQMNIKGSHF